MTRAVGRIVAVVLAVLCSLGLGAAHAEDDEGTLKKRFESRYATLQLLKDDGKVGETSLGFVEVVDSKYLLETIEAASVPRGTTIRSFVSEENSDRSKLYALIARVTSTKATLVATRNAKRLYEKASGSHFVKLPSGQWIQKKQLQERASAPR